MLKTFYLTVCYFLQFGDEVLVYHEADLNTTLEAFIFKMTEELLHESNVNCSVIWKR